MEARFNSLIVPSLAPEASVRPSREKATSQTAPLWPRKNLIFLPLGCQSPMVPSQLALAIHFPSGEKATLQILALCPSSMVGGPGRCVCQSSIFPSQPPITNVSPSGERAALLASITAVLAAIKEVLPSEASTPDG